MNLKRQKGIRHTSEKTKGPETQTSKDKRVLDTKLKRQRARGHKPEKTKGLDTKLKGKGLETQP